ncbi:DUF2470 domain-containing protein [Microbacteriaceae bacterium VKM Ac-2854]|nr:DUF2470 domain-containing protein [Microbacteriaceae bacterium VKM Ac-2854]
MPHTFAPEIVAAILSHMNVDHGGDGRTIVRAFAEPDADSVRMTALDGDAGEWDATVGTETRAVRIPWTTPITERAEIRREIVALYDLAATKLGLPPREKH